MPVDFLSDEQVARYRRFRGEVSAAELEQFFRLDVKALDVLAGKRRPAAKLGWAVQWGTVRMLGTFLTEGPLDVPSEVLEFVAAQLDVDPACAPEYLTRPKTAYEHGWEIRDLLQLAEFSKHEHEVRDYLAARVWSTVEGPRALFDRAVVHMLGAGILLPAGITTLTRLISEVRGRENARLYRTLAERTGPQLRSALAGLLQVPEGGRASELERLRTPPRKASGRVMTAELFRVAEIGALGAGAVPVEPVPAVKMAALARAERAGKAEQLRTFPKLRKAARTMASAVEVLMSAPEATADRLVSLVEVWKAIEEVVPRERLAAAVETVAAFVPVTDDDAAAEWRAELVKRYRTVQGFIELLLEVIGFRTVEAGTGVLAMVREAATMAKRRRRYGPGDISRHDHLITGSWRPLVYRNPDLPPGQIDKAAFVLRGDAPAPGAAPPGCVRRRVGSVERSEGPPAGGRGVGAGAGEGSDVAGAGERTGRASGRTRERAGGRLRARSGRSGRQHRGAVHRRQAPGRETRRRRGAAADEGVPHPGRRYAAPGGLPRTAAGGLRPHTSPTSLARTRPWRTSPPACAHWSSPRRATSAWSRSRNRTSPSCTCCSTSPIPATGG
ncbi:hypothetical protein GCM10022226_22230 [Sphaerisporangium flaviroseum]|uniref:DUF4158 domain-containing protein n=1 Tax=Sphaerisporangium flaviroseum TaxID=509199 RepID=A0ABP7HTX5_9ACTN